VSACLENEIFRDTDSGTEVQLQSDSPKLRARALLLAFFQLAITMSYFEQARPNDRACGNRARKRAVN